MANLKISKTSVPKQIELHLSQLIYQLIHNRAISMHTNMRHVIITWSNNKIPNLRKTYISKYINTMHYIAQNSYNNNSIQSNVSHCTRILEKYIIVVKKYRIPQHLINYNLVCQADLKLYVFSLKMHRHLHHFFPDFVSFFSSH